MVEGALGADAVVRADCVELPSPSPDNSSGVCELREAGALIALVLPVAVVEAVADPPVAPTGVPAENEELDGSVEVGTLSGSLPALVAVWACAVVPTPITMIALRIVRRITFSCFESDRRTAPPACNARQRMIRQKEK